MQSASKKNLQGQLLRIDTISAQRLSRVSSTHHEVNNEEDHHHEDDKIVHVLGRRRIKHDTQSAHS